MKMNSNLPAQKLLLVMKITLHQLLAVLLCTSIGYAGDTKAQELLDRAVSLKMEQQTLKNVLLQIERATSVKFVYSAKIIQASQRISVQAEEEKLATVLTAMLLPLNIGFEVVGQQIVLKRKPAGALVPPTQDFGAALESPQFKISGKVTDETNNPLIGASILVKGTAIGTITDVTGSYSFNLPDEQKNGALVFSYIGFSSQEIPINNQSVINIRLVPNAQTLQDVVVMGYGTQERRDITGAVGSVKAADISAVPVTGLDQALQGRVAGVQITQNDGTPGGGVSIRIRGISSTSGGEPLVIVDGFPIAGDLNSINPNDIASIEVLKDAASAAIYGSRASNGVVLVTTKRGKAGKTRVEFDAYYGVQQTSKKLEVLNGSQFATLANEAYTNSNRDRALTGGAPYALNPAWANPSSLPTYDWQDALFRAAPIQSYNLSVSGGSEKMRSALSMSYFRQDGIIPASNFARYSARLNTDYDASKFLRFGNSLTIANSSRSGVNADNENGVIANAYQVQPMQPIFNADGGFYHAFATPENALYLSRSASGNELARLEREQNRNNQWRILGNAFGEVEPIRGLKYRLTVGVDVTSATGRDWFPSFFVPNASVMGENRLSRLGTSSSTNLAWNVINTLSYTKTIAEKHELSAIVGIDALKGSFQGLFANANTIPNELPLISTSPITSRSVGDGRSEYSLASYFGRVTYAYDDKYLLTANLRVDGSSNFGPLNRWGTFPSVSAGWRISREAFMTNLEMVSDLKLRGSVGTVGNQNIGAFRYLSTFTNNEAYYTLGTGTQQDAPGIQVDNLGNPGIKWESVSQWDIGLDAAFFDNKLTFTADYFSKTTRDALVNIPVPAYIGANNNTITANVGSFRNRGFEFSAGYNESTKPLKWSVNGNISTLKNTVVSLGEGAAILQGFNTGNINFATRTAVGEPIASFLGLLTDGIYQNADEIRSGPKQGDNIKPGDRRYKDVNGDGKIDDADRVNLGNGLPNLLYGLNLRVEYKGVDLVLFLQGQAGNKILSLPKRQLYDIRNFNGAGVVNQAAAQMDRWTGPGTSNTLPRLTYDQNTNNMLASDFYIEDGSFLRVRNVQLGYTLPAEWIQRIGAERVRAYVGAQNLFTFTKYSFYDPEVGSLFANPLNTGVDRGRYPSPRMFLAGFHVTF